MNKKQLNETMNCECLQCILEERKNAYTNEKEEFDRTITEIAYDNGDISLECYMGYFQKIVAKKHSKMGVKYNELESQRNERYLNSIPFFYCPICGCKTKIDVNKSSFYFQLQKQKI
jgi:hypothetical protein